MIILRKFAFQENLICPSFLQQFVSAVLGRQIFKGDCPGTTRYHVETEYRDLREVTKKHPNGVFKHDQRKMRFRNSHGERTEAVLQTITLQEPSKKSIRLAHKNHLIYFLGSNSVFQWKINDLKTFARTGLTVHIANYSTKDCFADLVCQGNYTVEFLMKEYKMRADQIILIGDSFGGAVAEYVFMHFYNRKTILGGRIISNSFCDFSRAIDDYIRKDPTGFCANTIVYSVFKPLTLKNWNANPLASMHILTPLLFISNRHEDNTLVESQLSAHASNHCGFLDYPLAEKFGLIQKGQVDPFTTPSPALSTPTMERLLWATRVLYHHIRLKVRPNISKSRVDEVHGNVHDLLYSECEPLCAADSASTSSTTSCTSGTHHTTEMIEAFLTLSLFHHAQIKIKQTMQSPSWHRAVERVSSQRKSL